MICRWGMLFWAGKALRGWLAEVVSLAPVDNHQLRVHIYQELGLDLRMHAAQAVRMFEPIKT